MQGAPAAVAISPCRLLRDTARGLARSRYELKAALWALDPGKAIEAHARIAELELERAEHLEALAGDAR